MQDRLRPDRRKPLATRGRTIHVGQNATSACRCGMSAPPPETDKRERWLCVRSRRSRSLWAKPQTSSEKVKTFLPTSDALRAIAIEVLGYSNVGLLISVQKCPLHR